MKKRESDVCLQFKLQSKTEIERKWILQKAKKKNQKIRTKILIPSYCAKIKVREQSVKLQMVPPNMTTNESKSNPERAELGWNRVRNRNLRSG